MMPNQCPFCNPDPDRVWMENEVGTVLWEAFPVSKGHSLIVPKQHVASFYPGPATSSPSRQPLLPASLAQTFDLALFPPH